MMSVAITDANIFIDLYELELMEHLFRIRHEIHTTESVLGELNEEREVLEPYRQSNDLIIHNLKGDQYDQAIELNVPKGLSPTDRTVVWLSGQFERCIVLTGDSVLRKEIFRRQTEVHGIFWLFDLWVESYQLLEPQTAANRLYDLMEINDRIPYEECKKRIRRWGNL